MHKHRAKSETTGPFFGPVSPRQNSAAHGNVCVRAVCSCGAVRLTNVNGSHAERGVWS